MTDAVLLEIIGALVVGGIAFAGLAALVWLAICGAFGKFLQALDEDKRNRK